MIEKTALRGWYKFTCEICRRSQVVQKAGDASERALRAKIRKVYQWRACYIGQHWGTHDHCKECVEATEIRVSF